MIMPDRELGTAYTNGPTRRKVRTVIRFSVDAPGGAAHVACRSIVAGGELEHRGPIGLDWHSSSTAVLLPVDMEVDPGAEYDIYPEALGTGEVTLVSWTERDLA